MIQTPNGRTWLRYCPRCDRILHRLASFKKKKNGAWSLLCNDCVKAECDSRDEELVKYWCQYFDLPYVPAIWEDKMNAYRRRGFDSSPILLYYNYWHLAALRPYGYKDSELWNEYCKEKEWNNKVKIKKLTNTATIPTRGSNEAAGWDLYADIDAAIGINPHNTVMIGTGVAISLPHKTFGGIYPRSGLAAKQGLRLANCVGVVDSDYRGEVKVALHNDTNEIQIVSPGDRIAQLIIQPYIQATFDVVDDLDDTDRGAGGFGSTGK